ncbi:MAG: hypothetical protein AAFY22_04710 [Pseudomonadota bacterium]
MAEHDIRHSAGARAGERAGHAVSALAFIAMTALWAYIVRNDPYYSSVQVFGVTLPVKTAGYLTILPLTGYIIGRWRYRSAPRRAALPALASALAGVLHFLYSHILLVLFTGAVAVRTFVGWDMDEAVRSIDDRLFDIAARFAPWVSAYLAGFSIGRFFGAHAAGLAAAPHASDPASEAIGGPGDRRAMAMNAQSLSSPGKATSPAKSRRQQIGSIASSWKRPRPSAIRTANPAM